MLQSGFVGGRLGHYLLKRIGTKAAKGEGYCDRGGYRGLSKLEALFGPEVWKEFAGKTVIDFGCGGGGAAIEIAKHGARRVIGVDIQQRFLSHAKAEADKAGVAGRCVFTTQTDEKADVILSVDGFEHYADPEEILTTMRKLLKETGRVQVCFGPTWFHPYGGHLFSVFPWAHLVFTEKALIRWRSNFKTDGATRFCEVEGGLNQMTIRRFEEILARSDFRVERFEEVPIRKLRWLQNPLTREFCTSVVRCVLVPKR
jgi:SAM-dependent methyltransferase